MGGRLVEGTSPLQAALCNCNTQWPHEWLVTSTSRQTQNSLAGQEVACTCFEATNHPREFQWAFIDCHSTSGGTGGGM